MIEARERRSAGPARPVRAFPPSLPDEPVVIAPPPARPEPEGSRWATTVLPALSSLGIVGFALVSGSLLYVLLGIALSFLGVGAAIGARVGANRTRRRRQEEARRRYVKHLDERHEHLSNIADAQRRAVKVSHPDPAEWAVVLSGDRLWERRPGDADFLSIRLGRGREPLAVQVRLDPAAPATDEEGDLRHEAEMLVALHAAVDDLPVTAGLGSRRSLVIEGPDAHRRPLLRAVVTGLALTHAPGELRVLGLVDEAEVDWLALLPHTIGVASELPHLRRLLPASREGAVLVVADAEAAGADREILNGLLDDAGPGFRWLLAVPEQAPVPTSAAVHALLDPDGGLRLRFADGEAPRTVARPDALASSEAQAAATALASMAPAHVVADAARPVRLSRLLAEASTHPPLVVPLGRDLLGEPVELDLAEAAQGGDGPHGLLVGATGSGKSELLRSILAALVRRRSPDQLAVVCWDFKGGAAVAPFTGLPHLRATVTNLDSDPRLIDRATRSLRAEIRRRQQILSNAGVDSVAGLAATGHGSVPPTLLLVVDEFSELLSTYPDLLDLFVAAARLGRSLGIHLLLSSQRFDEGRLRGLESHLRYRICLRTYSATDSQTVLGSDAACRLPPTPGAGLLAVDGRLRRFDGALADDLEKLVATASAQARDGAVSAPALWPPDLPNSLSLDPPPPPDGLTLTPAIGLVDLPDEQTQQPLVLDLGTDHAAVVGAARSGRTTMLATLVVALAAANRSERLEMHVLTEDTHAFAGLADLPHVRTVLRPDDEEPIRHLLGTVVQRLRHGHRTDDRQTLLLVDNWTRLRQAGDELTDLVAELAAAGPRAGIHLVITGASWSDFRAGIREHLGTRMELRLADPFESEHGRRRASILPELPGRLLTANGDEAQVALPCLQGPAGVDGLPEAQRMFVAAVQARGDAQLPRLRPLPDRVALTGVGTDQQALVLGVDPDGEPEILEVNGEDRHLMIIGESGSGRTTALRTLVHQLAAFSVDLWVIDPRRTLLPAVGVHVPYAYSPQGAAELLADLARRLQAHRPPEGLTRSDLLDVQRCVGDRHRSVLVVDDYDLLPGAGLTGPLGPLTELLPFADEIGLSIVAARGTTGRLGFDPSWQALVDAAATGLLLSGDPSAGPVLGGLRAARRPPGRGLVVRRGRPPGLVQIAMSVCGAPGSTEPTTRPAGPLVSAG